MGVFPILGDHAHDLLHDDVRMGERRSRREQRQGGQGRGEQPPHVGS